MTTLGSGTNQIKPFATGVGANVVTPANWAANGVRQLGFQDGIALPVQANTVWRQGAFIASMIAQFMADFSSQPTNDDGDVLNAEQNFIDALKKLLAPFGVYFIVDTGTANAMIGTSEPLMPAPAAYVSPSFIVVKKMNADNTGAMTANFWGLGAVALLDNTAAPLGSGAIKSSSFQILAYDGGGFRVLGGVASYTSVTNLTANSGDMINVQVSGEVDFRTLRGTHNAVPDNNDRWPRGRFDSDIGEYMLTSELIAWIRGMLPSSFVNIQFITTTSNYVPTVGAKIACALGVGAGGGGGGGASNGTSGVAGAAGETVLTFFSVVGVASVLATIGTAGLAGLAEAPGGDGGTTTLGSLLSAAGGKGGAAGIITTESGTPRGALGGTSAGAGLFHFPGASSAGIGLYVGPNGAPSPFGSGGRGANIAIGSGVAGEDGKGYGSGGGAGNTYIVAGPGPAVPTAGGAGKSGAVLIVEFA